MEASSSPTHTFPLWLLPYDLNNFPCFSLPHIHNTNTTHLSFLTSYFALYLFLSTPYLAGLVYPTNQPAPLHTLAIHSLTWSPTQPHLSIHHCNPSLLTPLLHPYPLMAPCIFFLYLFIYSLKNFKYKIKIL